MNRPTTPVKIYLAAPWVWRNEARRIAELLRRDGFIITRNWWDKEAAEDDYSQLQDHAILDIQAVRHADAVIVLNLERSEGKAVETGVALTDGIPIVIVTGGQKRSNIFQTLCTEVETVADAVAKIREWYPRPVSA